MNSEKVKEIKYYLEQSACMYGNMQKQALTLINELESENEMLKRLREVDYKTMTTLRQANTELNECMDEMQDRIAELGSENERLKHLNNSVSVGADLHKESYEQEITELEKENAKLKDRIADLEKEKNKCYTT